MPAVVAPVVTIVGVAVAMVLIYGPVVRQLRRAVGARLGSRPLAGVHARVQRRLRAHAASAGHRGEPAGAAVRAQRRPEEVPYWTAQYFGYALREPMVIGVPIGLAFAWRYVRRRDDAAGRRRGGDDRGVRRRPAVRPAADPSLRRDAGRPAHALLRPRGVRLEAAAAAHPRAPRLDDRRRRGRPAVSRLPAVAQRQARRRPAAPRRRRRALRRPAGSRPVARDPRRVRALRPSDVGRPPRDPLPALLARGRPGHGRHCRGRRQPDGEGARGPALEPLDGPDLPRPGVLARRPAGRVPPDLPDPSWRVFAAPECA